MNKKNALIPAWCALAAAWIAALVFASLYDLEISLAIADPSSFFGRFLEVVGEQPAIIFTSFNFSLMMAHFIKAEDNRARNITLAVLTFIGTVGTAVFACVKFADYIAEWVGTELSSTWRIVAIIAALVLTAFFMLFSMRLDHAIRSKYFDIACRCAYAAIATFVVIWLFKLCWGRVRFRQLEGDHSLFTAWYMPQGFNGYFSFPSGHTANATVILTLTYYLSQKMQKSRRFAVVVNTLLTVWIVLLAFSRVRVGAHYLSDVLFGAAITFAIVRIFRPKNHDKN